MTGRQRSAGQTRDVGGETGSTRRSAGEAGHPLYLAAALGRRMVWKVRRKSTRRMAGIAGHLAYLAPRRRARERDRRHAGADAGLPRGRRYELGGLRKTTNP